MKYNDKHIPIVDIKAESIIAVLSDKDKPEVFAQGYFYRNFCEDIVEISNEPNGNIVIALSRDGIYHLLPEALFFFEKRLLIKKKGSIIKAEIPQEEAIKKEIEKQNAEKIQLLAFFKFFDTKYFATSLVLEKKIFQIENIKINFILIHFFGYDINNTDNQYIIKIAPLLIHAYQIRGDLLLLQKILSAVLNSRVEINKRNTFNDELFEAIMSLEFIVHIEGLSLKEYRALNEAYEPFFLFVSEWFLPFELDYRYRIKDKVQAFVLNKPLILDYNTQLLKYENK